MRPVCTRHRETRPPSHAIHRPREHIVVQTPSLADLHQVLVHNRLFVLGNIVSCTMVRSATRHSQKWKVEQAEGYQHTSSRRSPRARPRESIRQG